MIYIRIGATIFMFLQAVFLYGLTATGFEPNIFDKIILPLGFVAVILAIWL